MKAEDKIKMIMRLHSDIAYTSAEFEGKLFGSCPDGDVKFYQMVEFAKEYDWLLEMIIKIAKDLYSAENLNKTNPSRKHNRRVKI